MLSLFQCVYLVAVLAIGLSVIYLLRYYKKTGKLLGLIKFMLVVAIVAHSPVLAQDDEFVLDDDKPLVGDPMHLVESAHAIAGGADYLAEEIAIAAKVRAFLGDGDAMNITLLNNSTGLFYA